MLLFYSCIATISTLMLALKVYLLKAGLREMGGELSLILSQDTNRLIGLSSRDKNLRHLAGILNEQLEILKQERRRYQDGDRELKEAVTNISHDLRTPLTAISGYLELLGREEHSPQALRCLEIIKKRVDSMKQLTEELFRYSLALTPKDVIPEQLSLNKVLEESLLSFYDIFQKKKIAPQIVLPDTPVIRFLDKSALSRIFNNIISNAAKYSADDFLVTLDPDGIVTFSNTAPGLSPIMAAKLFDRFYTVENLEYSTGLGLSIARQLTEQIGGKITAEYNKGRLIITVCFSEVKKNSITT